MGKTAKSRYIFPWMDSGVMTLFLISLNLWCRGFDAYVGNLPSVGFELSFVCSAERFIVAEAKMWGGLTEWCSRDIDMRWFIWFMLKLCLALMILQPRFCSKLWCKRSLYSFAIGALRSSVLQAPASWEVNLKSTGIISVSCRTAPGLGLVLGATV